jgi:hypothetical protein
MAATPTSFAKEDEDADDSEAKLHTAIAMEANRRFILADVVAGCG